LTQGAPTVIVLHKFKVGQSVEFAGGGIQPKPLGLFKVVRVMPSERGIHQYRIKSATDGPERMVTESELL
jgi:hypothetical protein